MMPPNRDCHRDAIRCLCVDTSCRAADAERCLAVGDEAFVAADDGYWLVAVLTSRVIGAFYIRDSMER